MRNEASTSSIWNTSLTVQDSFGKSSNTQILAINDISTKRYDQSTAQVGENNEEDVHD